MLNKIFAIVLAAVLSVAYASPATPTDEYAVYQDGVFVCVELDTPLSEVRYGGTIVMRCIVYGIDGPYSLQWQSSKDTHIWLDLACTDPIYAFVLDKENANLYYRVVVHRIEDKE